MKMMVLDLMGIRLPTPCARRTFSLVLAVFYAPPSLPLRRAGISSILTVEGSTAAPTNSEVSAVRVVWMSVDGVDPNMDSIWYA